MKKLFSLLLVFTLAFSTLLCGCSDKKSTAVKSDKISIVASIFPYYDFARNIVEDKADVKLLLSPGNEPHHYEPSPSDIVAIEECDIFIYNGGESDEWVENVLDSLENKSITVLKMVDYVSLLNEKNPDHTDGDEEDEHIWTSVRNSERIVTAISDAVMDKDEKNKSDYENNTAEYISRLEKLDSEFIDAVNNKKRDTVVFGDRFPFLYFMTDYGLNYECAFPGCSSETEPSIEVVTRLIDYVRDENIPVVFRLEMSNGKTAQLIADDTGAKVLRFSSCHNITKDEFNNGEDYISLMEQNCVALKEALS